ncbi:MAG: hypothetical protein AAB909_04225 [Patescibacteria group bacterium]
MGAYIHEGVYGDHSTDGWLEWGLDEYYARKRAEGDYTPATNALSAADTWRNHVAIDQETADMEADKEELKAGLLAAAEARSRGYEINGWDSEEADAEYKRFFDPMTLGYLGEIAAAEAREQGYEIPGWEPEAKAA